MRILLFAALFALLSLLRAQSNQTCTVPTISVSGQGTTSGTPDTASFTVEIRTTSNTSLLAAQTTTSKITQVTQILTSNSISSSDIQTTSLSISPQYDYSSGSYPYPITGQTASTSVSVKINNINSDGTSVGRLYDQLSNIDGVSISNLQFDIKNKTALRSRARTLAYEQAQSNAAQFASFAGFRLGLPQLINEQTSYTPVVPIFRQQNFVASAMALDSPQVSTSVTTGSFQVAVNTQYTFYLI